MPILVRDCLAEFNKARQKNSAEHNALLKITAPKMYEN